MAEAQMDSLDKIDSFVRAEMGRQKIPGIALGIVNSAGVLAAKGYGLANVEHQVPVGPETILQSGSVGKQFTSAAVMLLGEQGKIGLDDPITKYFPGGPAAWQAITVHHPLTHTSGIADYAVPGTVDFRRDHTKDELAQLAFGLKLEFPPGSRWNYSNTGYLLPGIIIHKASG
jgi:CubicO group peptidase (beta-lactamase class C family)